MTSRTFGAALAALLAVFPPPRAAAAAKPDHRKAAARIVESAAIEEGDLVVIGGEDVATIDLVEEISVAVAARGGHPLQLLGREKTDLRYYTDVPEKYDATRFAFWQKVTEIMDVVIWVDWVDTSGLYRSVPPARMTAVSQSYQKASQTMLRRGVRQVFVGNALTPTASMAARLGLSQPDLARIFWDALATDPSRIQANGAAVKGALAGAKQIRVTHPNGTDLRFGVEGQRVVLSDGAITPDRIAQGGASAVLALPAGEAQVAAVPGTAEGVVIFDRVPTGSGTIEKLRWTFQGGKRVAGEAKPGAAWSRARELYEAAGPGKDVFAGIDFGLHPGARAPAGKTLLSYIPAGAVSLCMGDNTYMGGTNQSEFGSCGFLPGATVEADGKVIVEKGVLKARP
jgi:leucyl aminopeptidase (aminopeptidase T)